MNLKYSILHISELHRSNDGSLPNNQLAESILKDLDNINKINEIKLIIVSGDLVQGSKLSDTSAKKEVETQYDNTKRLLDDLCNAILQGDKEKVILVPGNHDVSWNHSLASMRKTSELHEDMVKYCDLRKEGISKYRWNWNDLSYYEIKDAEKYNNRFQDFKNFYDTWYSGSRKFSLDPKKQFDFFDFPELSAVFIGMNSCFRNDHLNLAGEVNADALAAISKKLRKMGKRRIVAGVWHHNTSGGPLDDDYLHPHFLQTLINLGFNLGFHGHQHSTEVIKPHAIFNSTKKIVTISAGSLCADWKELPQGQTRQFNVIHYESGKNTLELMVRKHIPLSMDMPVWSNGEIDGEIKKSFIIDFNEFKVDLDKEIKSREKKILLELIGNRKYRDVLQKFNKPKYKDDKIVRKTIIEALIELNEDHRELVQFIGQPENDSEAIQLFHSLRELNNKAYAKSLILALNFDKFDTLVLQELKKLKKWVG